MKTGWVVRAVSLAALAGLVLAPAAALAGGSHRGPGGGHRPPHGFGARPPAHPRFPGHHGRRHGHHHHGHRHFARPFASSAFLGAPYVVYAPPLGLYGAPSYPDPPAYAPPPVYAPAPVVYAPPPAYDPPAAYVPAATTAPSIPAPPPAPPAPSVVEYPTGRYELRGDGLAVPYAWVWIPNPPPGPPPGAGSPAGDRPARQLYRWTDEEGTEHWTDRREAVPARYRTPDEVREPS
jgi:hypothetical protein